MSIWKFPLRSRKTGKSSVYEWAINSKIFSVFMFLVSAIIGFYLFVPTEALKDRLVHEIERQTPVKMKLAELKIWPLLTFTGEEIELVFSHLPSYSLRLNSFSVDPWWSSLIRGRPGVNGSLDGLGGQLEFSANKRGDFTASAEGLHLELPLTNNASLQLVGDLSSALVEGFLPLQSAAKSRIEIELSQLQVRGLDFLAQNSDDLSLGQVRLSAVGELGALKIVQLEASGGAIEITGAGDLLIAGNLPKSRLNINLVVRPGSGASPGLTDLLALAGPRQADGGYRLRLTGTLEKPLIN